MSESDIRMNQAPALTMTAGVPGRAPVSESGGINLLQFRPIAIVVRWRYFPNALQLMVLGIFLSLAFLGWGHFPPEGVNPKLYAKTNLVNLAIWGLWWPCIIWLTFFLGRAWCMVCPLELISKKGEQLGLSLGLRQQRLPGWLATGSLMVLFFAFLQMLVPGVQIHRVPHYTSLFLWISLALAFGTGLFFRDRAFCRGFCPVALLLSAYGRGGMLAVRPSCGNGRRQPPNQRTCRSLLNPARLNTNKDCVLCGDCLKSDSAAHMQLLLRKPFSNKDDREPFASWPLTLFVMIASGFVTYELSGVWKAAETVFLWVPRKLNVLLNAGDAAGFLQGLWTILIVPLFLWLILALPLLLSGGAKSLAEAWRRLALPMAVIVAAGHMGKALEKFTSWAGFLPYAWAEPLGTQTAIKMHTMALAQPAAWFSLPALSLAAVGLLALGILLAWREACLERQSSTDGRLVSILLLGGFYLVLVLGWGNWL